VPDHMPQTIALTLVIATGDDRHLLTNGELTTVTLPASPWDSWWLDALNINRALYEQLDLRAIVLRCLDIGQDPNTGERTATFLVESLDSDWTPGDQLTLEPFDSNVSAKIPLSPLSSDPPLWTYPGWFDDASAWMRGQLEAAGMTLVGEVEQVRSWFLSCILRVATDKGDYYLKSVPPLFKHEPLLTLDLSEHHPGFVPDVVAANTTNHWTLMRNVPGVKLITRPDKVQYIPRWEDILRRLAEVQLDYMNRTDDLLSMGCFDFRLNRLYTDAEILFAQLPRLLEGATSLSPEQFELLTQSLPRLRAMCDTLIASGLPITLHHGDFHSGNILCDQSCVVLDWSGFVGVSHPFLFLSVVSEEHSDPTVLSRLIDIYLSAWSAYAPLTTLREYAYTGIVLGWLAGALGHSRQIAIADGPWDRKQEQGNLEYCLKMLLPLLSA
jgi:hypothetical protein